MITVGIIQILFGVFKLAKLMNFISKPTVLGFLNGLAIIILLSQLHAFREPESAKELSVEKIFSSNSYLANITPSVFANITYPIDGFVVTDTYVDMNKTMFHLEISSLPYAASLKGKFFLVVKFEC